MKPFFSPEETSRQASRKLSAVPCCKTYSTSSIGQNAISQRSPSSILPSASAIAVAVAITCSACLLAMVNQRSEEHTSELQSLMRISYAVFCLKKKKHKLAAESHPYTTNTTTHHTV